MWKIEPFGGIRGDYQAAKIAQTIANFSGISKGLPLENFLLDFGPETEQTEEEIDQAVRMFGMSHGK